MFYVKHNRGGEIGPEMGGEVKFLVSLKFF
jgi:hypothetical protein